VPAEAPFSVAALFAAVARFPGPAELVAASDRCAFRRSADMVLRRGANHSDVGGSNARFSILPDLVRWPLVST